MKKLDLLSIIRRIAREEIARSAGEDPAQFGGYSDDSSPTVSLSNNEASDQTTEISKEASEDDIVLPRLTSKKKNGGTKSGRGRVTKSTDKRLRANKK